MQLKKAAQTQPKREQIRKSTAVLAPVIDLKSKRDDDDSNSSGSMPNSYFNRVVLSHQETRTPLQPLQTMSSNKDFDWNIINEYDPMWPNDYEKVVKDLREIRDKEREKEELEELERRKKAREERNGKKDRDSKSGFPGRKASDDEDEERDRSRTCGVAIAPPPSLQENKPEIQPLSSPKTSNPNISFAGSAVAAKIMAKYGFKEGQGLGKKEQGMSLALQVEKTSKRGGRIIHEKDILMPPPTPNTPPQQCESPNPPPCAAPAPAKPEPSITEIMKCPSKVVLLRNMVGPGEIDDDLEPEVKDECNTKYGEVLKVLIFEMPSAPQDEAIRIFVEFRRIESAIKAVVDLNGRFFGGRQVKAGFYVWEKFNNLELLE
ncbi:UNVERIFIED_CONTAM: hypothetical protein PYX00_000611 [Menopon gallinae]